MYTSNIVVKENLTEFFEKISLDNDPENLNFIKTIPSENKTSPSFYEVNARKKQGYKRYITDRRFRGQRDGKSSYSLNHKNRAYNHLCKKAVSESCHSVIQRGYYDYLDDIEDEQTKYKYNIRKVWRKASLIEERNKTVLTMMLCSAKIKEIDDELASIDLE